MVDALVDLLALLDLDLLVDLVLPVDVLLVEAFDHFLVDALFCFELEVGTEGALLGFLVLVSLPAVQEQLFPPFSQRLILDKTMITSSYRRLKMLPSLSFTSVASLDRIVDGARLCFDMF